MKRKATLIILSLVCALCCAFGIIACNNGEKPSGGDVIKVDGTYYYCENDVTDEQIYITFKNGKWTDDEDETGEYSLSGNSITLYVELAGEKEEFAVGTVSGDNILLNIMGSNIVYRKGEDIGNKPKEKTLEYALSADRTSYIVKGIGGLTGDIEIPDEYKHKPVTEIAENAFANCKDITGAVIGNNVINVGAKAFFGCTNLISAVLGESVNKLAESTFEGCKQLEKVTVSASVKKFEYDAFKDCGVLIDIYFTGTISDWAAIDFAYSIGYEESIKTATPFYATYLTSTGMQEVYRKLYIDGEPVTAADLFNATSVNSLCFYRYKYLESVTIGGAVEEIGEYAFYGCKNLSSVRFDGDSLKTIGQHAFDGYCSVNSVALPDSVKRIEKFAFNNCEQLSSVNTGNGVVYIGEGVFMGCAALSSLTLGSSVSEICETAFYSCAALTVVTIPASAIFIGAEAFMYTGLTSATFNNTSGWQVLQGKKYVAVENLDDKSNAAELLKTSILSNGYADYDWEKPTLEYTLSDDGSYYTVSNDGTACRSEIVIPATYNDKPVKALADRAFEYCKSLTYVTLPACMQNIPASAFYGCTSLENIEIDGVSENYATRDGILYNADYTQIVLIPSAKTDITVYGNITDSMFAGNNTLKNIVIADGVTSIGSNAFSGCSTLTSITIGNDVTSIGEGAFWGCKILTIYCETASAPSGWNEYWNDSCPVVWDCRHNDKDENGYAYAIIGGIRYQLKDGVATVIRQSEQTVAATIASNVAYNNGFYKVTGIGEYAFSGCENLASITIPDSVISIGYYAFYECNSLIKIDYTGNIASWCGITGLSSLMSGNSVLYIDGKEITGKLVIPNGAQCIGDYAFYRCKGLSNVIIENGVTAIGAKAFEECYNLTGITVPDSITSIGYDAFKDCEKLSYTIYNSAKYLGDNDNPYIALIVAADKSITSCTIHNNTKVIASYAFYYCCDNLTSITIPDGVTSISDNAFRDCRHIETATIPSTAISAIEKFALKTVVITSGDSIEPNAFYNCENLMNVTICNGVKTIESAAFQGCGNLTNITMPNSLTCIDAVAFQYCSGLTSITIPDSVTIIGSQAFRWCSGLTSVTIPDSVTSIEIGAFEDCRGLTSVIIGNGVTALEQRTFYGCDSLTSVTISNSVTHIGWAVLNGCGSLSSITFQGTKAQWNAIRKDDGWNNNTGNYTIHCTDGDIAKS